VSVGHDFVFGVYCVGGAGVDAVVAYFAEFWYSRVFFYFGVCVGSSMSVYMVAILWAGPFFGNQEAVFSDVAESGFLCEEGEVGASTDGG